MLCLPTHKNGAPLLRRNSVVSGGPCQGGNTPPLILLDCNSSSFSLVVCLFVALGAGRLLGEGEEEETFGSGPAVAPDCFCFFHSSALASIAAHFWSSFAFSAAVGALRCARM
jgi:hypothetical protein